jgi:hypothetical protein
MYYYSIIKQWFNKQIITSKYKYKKLFKTYILISLNDQIINTKLYSVISYWLNKKWSNKKYFIKKWIENLVKKNISAVKKNNYMIYETDVSFV